jgi:formylglycine-generating enzyme required for sulfatase activity
MGAGFWGHQDLAGNAMEWTLDHCSDCNPPDYAQPGADLTQYLITPCDDCVETSGSSRILRGGSFKFWTALGRTATRVAEPPNNSYDDVGFRCARDPG